MRHNLTKFERNEKNIPYMPSVLDIDENIKFISQPIMNFNEINFDVDTLINYISYMCVKSKVEQKPKALYYYNTILDIIMKYKYDEYTAYTIYYSFYKFTLIVDKLKNMIVYTEDRGLETAYDLVFNPYTESNGNINYIYTKIRNGERLTCENVIRLIFNTEFIENQYIILTNSVKNNLIDMNIIEKIIDCIYDESLNVREYLSYYNLKNSVILDSYVEYLIIPEELKASYDINSSDFNNKNLNLLVYKILKFIIEEIKNN